MAKKSDKKAVDATKLPELRETIRAIRFSMTGSRTKNVKEVRNIRKNIARILTAANATK